MPQSSSDQSKGTSTNKTKTKPKPKTKSSGKTETNTKWSHEFDTLRRENLFRNPPRDHTPYPALKAAIAPHIESFNAVFEDNGLITQALRDIGPKTFLDGDARSPPAGKNQLTVRIREVRVLTSELPDSNKFSKVRKVLPAECRERHSTYRGKIRVRFEASVNGGPPREITRDMGQLPMMVMSDLCHLKDNPPALLVARKEEAEELGGYFVVNGIEKIIRLLIVNRRNFPMAIERPSFAGRGASYTKWGVIIRSVRPDQTSQTNVLHYLDDGNVIFRFSWRKAEFLVPVMMIMKALVETNDREIFDGIAGQNRSENSQSEFLFGRTELLLRTYKQYGLYTKRQTRALLGEKFRVVLDVPDTMSNYDCGTEFLRKIVLVHLGNVNVTDVEDNDKFKMLLFMTKKLYALVSGECAVDNPDAVQNQEILLGGFLYGMIIKERLNDWLSLQLRLALRDWQRRNPEENFQSPVFLKELSEKIIAKTNTNIGGALEYFLSTGNLVSPTGLDLQQVSGFTVVAEKINFLRFISHFRMVHRGSFFAQLKTTTVRKLLPESWGFLCPVHTPDGSPCGLLNHLAHKCRILVRQVDVSGIPRLVVSLGAVSSNSSSTDESVVVQLDGKILGWCTPKQAVAIADSLRYWKVEGTHGVPKELEIGHVPNSRGGQYPGIYMSSGPSRFIRPVKYLPLNKEDFIGPQEQPFMSIAVTEPEIVSGESTHVEFDPTHILSILANMTPFSDHNQSPRNMYQCQMGKQSMGTPGTAIRYRDDNKTYRLQTGQTPIVRAPLHNEYGFDNFPNGMNAVVAVISYTGYDMDDAMIINKSGHERGFGHGTVYKVKKYDLEEGRAKSRSYKQAKKIFGFAPGAEIQAGWRNFLDADGLPYIGRMVQKDDIICAWHTVAWDGSGNFVNNDRQTHFEKYKEAETAFIEEVRLIGSENGTEPFRSMSVKFRVPRAPVVGDKFSSRHGQKGVCSQMWPSPDMPFSESGLQPDIIINPHAFPSRMTIGMFVESLAGKAGALHGLAQDSTPFRFDEENTAADHFGHQLMKAGYNYHGNEPMYSGITGEELHADIFIGVVYYQRLRHMVNDKYQVRTTGPIAELTGQPIKGRKRGGGIRVGEMERDSLLAHGAAFLLQDRLLNCSDLQRSWLCKQCGTFLSTQPTVSDLAMSFKGTKVVRCRRCAHKVQGLQRGPGIWDDGQGQKWLGGDDTTVVAVPGVLKYLDVELAAMGIKLKYNIERPNRIVQDRR
ncbi:DNA-directed RNA polymerase subunit beta [Venustampulla echinocandica]|uniref:DNA-directed RNA polymerase subunit beta n=1 Tax=Venustampulla echinocandica TaxID=2656787 RepID=A0A370TN44_9HELO|nr:DNA-directed RNA polymerase subunit beta [Venustampulla echinocandica]RDL36946.1 DNA-directed RNA polymerase subunit beta [Venustampulla echinocandica]